MLPAVYFDDEPARQTGKVGDVRTDRTLAAELMSGKAPRAEPRPKQFFRIGRRMAQVVRGGLWNEAYMSFHLRGRFARALTVRLAPHASSGPSP